MSAIILFLNTETKSSWTPMVLLNEKIAGSLKLKLNIKIISTYKNWNTKCNFEYDSIFWGLFYLIAFFF